MVEVNVYTQVNAKFFCELISKSGWFKFWLKIAWFSVCNQFRVDRYFERCHRWVHMCTCIFKYMLYRFPSYQPIHGSLTFPDNRSCSAHETQHFYYSIRDVLVDCIYRCQLSLNIKTVTRYIYKLLSRIIFDYHSISVRTFAFAHNLLAQHSIFSLLWFN